MRCVITGAGQIGTQLAHDLTAAGHDVTVIRRDGHAPEGTALVRGDAGDREVLQQAVRGASAIFHCIHSSYSAAAWERDLPHREQAVMDVAAQADVPVVFPESVYAFGLAARDLREQDGRERAADERGRHEPDPQMREAADSGTPSASTADTASAKDLPAAPSVPASPLGRVRARLLAARAAHPARTLSVVAADLLGPTASPGTSVFLSLVLEPAARGRRAWVMGDPDSPRSATYIPDLTQAMIVAAQNAHELAPSGDAVLLAPSLPPLSQRRMAAEAARAAEAASGPEAASRSAITAGTAAVTPPVTGIPRWVFRAAGFASPMARELGRQHYLWADRAVLHPGRLTAEHGLEPASWEHVLREWACMRAAR